VKGGRKSFTLTACLVHCPAEPCFLDLCLCIVIELALKIMDTLAVYIPQIDGLRAIAVSMVVVTHCFGPLIAPGGHIGVDIFFVISGYLITTLMVKEAESAGTISIKNFYMRRLFRIAPAFLTVNLFVVLTVLAGSFVSTNLNVLWELRNVLFAMTSSMNWARAFGWTEGGFLGHTWSLSIEEQFYLLWPLALSFALAKNVRPKTLVFGILCVALALASWRVLLAFRGGDAAQVYNRTDTRADGLLLGCAIALVGEIRLPVCLQQLWFAPFALLIAVFMFLPWDSKILLCGGYGLVAVCAAWILLLVIYDAAPFVFVLRFGVAIWLGKRSYSLYLWHFPIVMVFAYAKVASIWTGMLALVIALVAADLSYRMIERPFLQLKTIYSAGGAGPRRPSR
jgi:peptidoglycan/LPS O-acetylase OafA/YrhL